MATSLQTINLSSNLYTQTTVPTNGRSVSFVTDKYTNIIVYDIPSNTLISNDTSSLLTLIENSIAPAATRAI